MSERQTLIAGYFDGDLDAAAREELAALLEHDASAAGEFDEALHIEALLRAAHTELPSSGARRRSPWRLAAVAAAVLAAATGAWLGSRESTDHQVLAGRVLVDGQEVSRIPEGAALEVAGNGPATIRLADGSRAELSPASRAVLCGGVGELRQVVKLDRGKGDFNVEKGAKKFRVDTPVGKVTVLGTEFSVELRPAVSKGEGKMKGKMALALVVAVAAGSVRVDFDGKEHVLSVGQQRVFGREREGDGKKESGLPESVRGFSGRVRGAVVTKGKKHTFTFKVGRVLKTWKGSKAKKPAALVGLTIKIGPRWQKNKRGKWRPVEIQVLFIRKLKAGSELTLEVRNVERDEFAILELDRDQRTWALKKGGEREGEKREGERREGEKKEGERREGERREGDRPRRYVLSDGKAEARFLGLVLGREGAKLKIKILKVGKAHKKLPVGKTVIFAAQWEKKEGGGWRPSRREMKVFKALRRGDRVECGAYFDKHPRLCIVELAGGGEKERKEHKDGKREGKHREGEKREGEKKEGAKKEGGDDLDF